MPETQRLLKSRRASHKSSDPVLCGPGESSLGAATRPPTRKGERH